MTARVEQQHRVYVDVILGAEEVCVVLAHRLYVVVGDCRLQRKSASVVTSCDAHLLGSKRVFYGHFIIVGISSVRRICHHI